MTAREACLKALRALRRSPPPWLLQTGVQGAALARRITAGSPTKDWSLKVYVERKLPLARCAQPVPATCAAGQREVATDVEEIGVLRPESCTTQQRPARPGCSIGNIRDARSGGTLGCLVRRRGDPALYLLSCLHVIGMDGMATVGTAVLQQGPRDGGGAAQRIATLSHLVTLDFAQAGYPNRVDAALARVDDAAAVSVRIRLLDLHPQAIGTRVREKMEVKKCGRTTDVTYGRIQATASDLRMVYRTPQGDRLAGFDGLVVCSRYTADGDSGAVVLDRQDRVVGLHMAGSGSKSVFARATEVFRALDIELA